MKQLTIRGFDKQLEKCVRELARREGVSLNRAVLRLLRKGAGLEDTEDRAKIGSSLDRFFGTWTAEEAAEFDRAVSEFERIDDELWR